MSYASYAPYAHMLASAQRRPERWRVIIGLIIAFLASAILTPLYLGVIGANVTELRAFEFMPDGTINIGTTRGGLLLVLSSFAILLMATALTAKHLHNRSLKDLVGPGDVLRTQFWLVLKWCAGLTFVVLLLPLGDTDIETHRQVSIATWLMWLPLGAVGLMIQVVAEEIFFRGYLQTQLVTATKSYSKGMVLAALIFGLGHISTSIEGPAALFPVIWATLFGLVAGDLTARTGSLGPALAIHFLNNTLAMFISPTEGQLSGFGLWVREVDLSEAFTDPFILAFEVISLLILWLVARIVLKR